MTLTRRGLFGSVVALLALPRKVAAERLLNGRAARIAELTPLIRPFPVATWSRSIEIPRELLEASSAMGRAAAETLDEQVLAAFDSLPWTLKQLSPVERANLRNGTWKRRHRSPSW